MFIAERGNLVCDCGNNYFQIHIPALAAITTMAFRCTECENVLKYKDDRFLDMREGEDR